MPVPNPYTPGQIPRVLAGRARERAEIDARLVRVETFGELGGPLLAFHAPRGLGKTSLLRAAERDALSRGFVAVWVAATPRSRLLAEVGAATRRAVESTDAARTGTGRRWTAALDKLQIELGIPGAKVTADLAVTAPADPPAVAAPVTALEELLGGTARLAREHGAAGLLLVVDEVHAAHRDELGIVLNALQNLDGRREDNPVAVLAAGLPSTPEALTRAATFGERSSFMALDTLSETESATALSAPAEALEVAWETEALRHVITDAAGYPYFLQLLGHSSWAAARPRAGGRITRRDVEAGYPDAIAQLAALYQARWRAAAAGEQDFIVATVREMAETGRDVVARAEVARRLGKDSRAISVPRDRLIDKGVIEVAGRGLFRFTLPGFAAYVAGQLDLPTPPIVGLPTRFLTRGSG